MGWLRKSASRLLVFGLLSRVPTYLPPCGRFNKPESKQREPSEVWARVARSRGDTSKRTRNGALQFGHYKPLTAGLYTSWNKYSVNHGHKHEQCGCTLTSLTRAQVAHKCHLYVASHTHPPSGYPTVQYANYSRFYQYIRSCVFIVQCSLHCLVLAAM
jgi:hypothetical protein